MTKRTTSTRRRMVNEVINLLAKGASDAEARQYIAEQYGRKRRVQYEVVALANRELSRRAVKDRSVHLGRTLAKVHQAQKTAMQAQKVNVHWTEDDEAVVHRENAPDLAAFNAAIALEAKLLGLNAPERKEIVVASIGMIVDDMAELLHQFISEPARRREFLAALKKRVAARLAERPDLQPVIDAGAHVVEGEKVSSSSNTPHTHTNGLNKPGRNGTPG